MASHATAQSLTQDLDLLLACKASSSLCLSLFLLREKAKPKTMASVEALLCSLSVC